MLSVLIARRAIHGGEIAVLDLVAPDGAELPPFEPGAHVDVEIGPDLIRQYSLCSDPADRSRYRLAVLREPTSRGGSQGVHDHFHEGRTIRIGRPRNLFPLHVGKRHTVLVAGGIGITPLLAMAYRLHSLGAPFTLHYCVRSIARAAFLEEIQALPFASRLVLHADDGDVAQRFDPARDLPSSSEGVEVHFCGPAGFMKWLEAGCRQLGYSPEQLHQEHFSAEADTSGGSFEVELAQTGITVTVRENQSIVQALAGAGVKVETMCQQGICGTCICTVLDGIPDHRDSFLTDAEREENREMLICCSRAKSSRLVLDL